MHLPSRPQALRQILTLSLSAIFFATASAEKINLDRITPVPASDPIPLEDFFRPRILQEPKLNPAGTQIAAVITAGGDKHQLLVYDLKTQKIEGTAPSGDKDIYDVNWLNDTRLVFGLSAKKIYGVGLLAADVGSIGNAYPLMQYYGSQLISVPTQNRTRPLIWNRYDSLDLGRDIGVVAANSDIHSGHLVDLLAAGAGHSNAMDARDNNEKHVAVSYPQPPSGLTTRYLADRDGQLAYAFTAEKGIMTMLRLEGEHWIKCPVDLEHIEVVGYGDKPGQVVVVGPRQEGKPRALQVMTAATGELGEVLLQDQAYDFNGWLYRDPATHELLGAVFDRNGPRAAWFREENRQLQKIFDGYFPGLVTRVLGSDEAGKRYLVSCFSDRQPAIFNWIDLETRTVNLFKNSAPWIDPKRMQPQNIIKFKTRDGRQLDAYLTLPAGASKQNPPPLVVLPHGGPWARDTWGFDNEAQFLASRGYAVLKPNYRGSTGYNWMFPEEDEWDFRKMHDDVTDATKAAVASGLIDAARIAIMGGSFGGYLAVSGAVNEPALYRCAVTISGVFDWEQLIADNKYNKYENPTYGRLTLKLGDPKKEKQKFANISPGRNVDQIRIPVFVAHGGDDPVVDVSQSKRLISELNRNHVAHESLIVGSEGHGMHHLDNQVELYTQIEAFLAKNLKR